MFKKYLERKTLQIFYFISSSVLLGNTLIRTYPKIPAQMNSEIPTVTAKYHNAPFNPYAYFKMKGTTAALRITGGKQPKNFLLLGVKYVRYAAISVAREPKIISIGCAPVRIPDSIHPAYRPDTDAGLKSGKRQRHSDSLSCIIPLSRPNIELKSVRTTYSAAIIAETDRFFKLFEFLDIGLSP